MKQPINKQVTIDEALFSDLIIQVGTLKEIYTRISADTRMNVFQKKVLLKNKEKNIEILTELEKLCENM